MSVVKISALTVVVADAGVDLVRQAAARADAAGNQDGFEGSELLKPADERTTWLIVTRWRDEESYQAWLHWRAAREPRSVTGRVSGASRPGAARTERGPVIKPVASIEQWSYEVAAGSAGAGS
ncbi:MAG TPA: antibiotic biosynthesis monooxygenase family protein [Streptosporangiaceae bacterium]|jgi:heme-degrading monooxygenase HmoA